MTRWTGNLAAALSIALALGCKAADAPPAATTSATPTPGTAPGSHTMAASQPSAPVGALTLVSDPSLVCMVNNQFMGRPQIPVEVQGRTYYGCCEMCKGKLANDPTSRTAVDPVSHRPVDKAVAVIGKAESGATVYFENKENFAAYSGQMRAN